MGNIINTDSSRLISQRFNTKDGERAFSRQKGTTPATAGAMSIGLTPGGFISA